MFFRRRMIQEVAAILDSVADKLPSQDGAEARELLDHDEWGLALSLVCTQLCEYDLKVSREVYARIESAANMMGLDREEWAVVEVED